MRFFSEKNLHTFFDAGIILKTIDSVGALFVALIIHEYRYQKKYPKKTKEKIAFL